MKNKWYSKGVHFKCTECGKCCTGAPGFVWVSEEEIAKMAEFLAISISEFKKKYVRRVGQRFSLVESKQTYDCVFLKNKQCSVYGARPTQCRTFPYWPQILHSKAAWEQTAQVCEGIDPNAPLVEPEHIEEQLLIQLRRNDQDG